MKTLHYAIEDFQIGKESLIKELNFEIVENYYFTNKSSFYRKYNLELGLDVCILELDIETPITLFQYSSKIPLKFSRITELKKLGEHTKMISNSTAEKEKIEILNENQRIRSLWFAYSERWLENKNMYDQNNLVFCTSEIENKPLLSNLEIDTLFNEIFSLANNHPIRNFTLKLKLYAFLEHLFR